MNNIESNQLEAPSPIPRGISPGAKKFHLYRQIVNLYEQAAILRVTAHTHAPTAVIESNQSEGPSPIPQGVSPSYRDEHLYQEIVRLHEQLASLRATAHLHTAVKTDSDIDNNQFEGPSPIPQGVSPSYRDEHLYQEIVRLHEQLASLRATAHLHTATGAQVLR